MTEFLLYQVHQTEGQRKKCNMTSGIHCFTLLHVLIAAVHTRPNYLKHFVIL